MDRQVLKVSAFRAPAGTLISRPSDRRMLSAIPACIGRRCAVADRIADNRVDRTPRAGSRREGFCPGQSRSANGQRVLQIAQALNLFMNSFPMKTLTILSCTAKV